MSDQNPDREKLARTIFVQKYPESEAAWDVDGDAGKGHWYAIADAILTSEWLREHDERVRREAAAEQREKDYAAVIAAAPPINAELNPITGAEDDPVMSAYVEGFRDAAAAIREQGNDARS